MSTEDIEEPASIDDTSRDRTTTPFLAVDVLVYNVTACFT